MYRPGKRKVKKQSEASDTVKVYFHFLATLSLPFYQPGQIRIFHATGLPADSPTTGELVGIGGPIIGRQGVSRDALTSKLTKQAGVVTLQAPAYRLPPNESSEKMCKYS